MLVYLAGPIDDVDQVEAAFWREEVARDFPDIMFYSPCHAFRNVNKAHALSLDWANRAVISRCDILLANLLGPGMGFGTVREIEYAAREGKKVAVAARELPSLLTYDVFWQRSVNGALLAALGKGEPVPDPYEPVPDFDEPPAGEDHMLAQVAKICKAAYARRLSAAVQIARAYGVSHTTADKYIRLARERGFLDEKKGGPPA